MVRTRFLPLLTLLIIGALLAKPALAEETWAVGTVAESNAAGGLSVQYMPDIVSGMHVATHLFEEERFLINVDYQRFFYPYFEWAGDLGMRLGFYSGIGLKGESRKEDKTEEFYSMRLPLGVQMYFYQMHLQVFSDFSGEVGELPETKFAMAGRIGLRAAF